MRTIRKKQIFCCYNAELKDYLYKHGQQYEICALSPSSHNMFWAYVRNEQLDKLLTEWSNRNR